MSAASESIFAKIVSGAIPCHKVYESAHALAFLDINPLARGHTLVIPKRAVETLDELSPDEAAELGRAVCIVASRVRRVTRAAGYNILQNNGRVAGQEVPYVHFHIIPRATGDGLGFRWNPQKSDPAALAALAAELSNVE
jgi:histidine triad (HIT) family protein